MIAILLADGFEEIEALTPLDLLRRAGLDARLVAVGSKIAIGSHGIAVVCDMVADEVSLSEVTMAIFPGGMPSSLNLDASPFTDKIIEAINNNGGKLAAICAAPLIFGRRGLLEGKRAICYPGFESELKGAEIADTSVVTDGNITTAIGMGAALDFSLEIISVILGKEKAAELAAQVSPAAKCALKGSAQLTEEEAILIKDEKFLAAVDVALTIGKISTSLIQRKLSIGYGKAAKFLDLMENMGIVGKQKGQNQRELLITREEWEKICSREKNN